jgi:Ser/Thr protein kinase RdoA (MazF antagonist)
LPEQSTRPFAGLGPETVLESIESLGLLTDGRLLPLGSYENRVWQVGLDAALNRWWSSSTDRDAGRMTAIEEEHRFSARTGRRRLSVVAPLILGGTTICTLQRVSLCRVSAPRRPRPGTGP